MQSFVNGDKRPALFSLKWSNYQANMMTVIEKILRSESFSDVTLVCGDPGGRDMESTQFIKAHKIILGASSPFFETVLSEHPGNSPIVIMPTDVKLEDLQYVLQFVYRGEVQVPQDQLEAVLRCASQLRIKGLESAPDTYSRESSLEPDRPSTGIDHERPSSQQSGSSKRKSSPKFHFLKNRRKNLLPAKLEEIRNADTEEKEEIDEAVHNESQSERWDVPSPGLDTGPVDFTIKNEPVGEERQVGSPAEDHEEDQEQLPDMAMFIASAAAAVRTAGEQFHQPGDMMGNLSEQSPHFPLVPFPTYSQSTKTYSKRDMNLALEALKLKKMSLSRASEVYGIPPTTLWQRANRLGIPTPKKETSTKTWTEEDLTNALTALRNKEISANKAAKVYKIPSSTLYKIARKEGIELAQPFNAVATTWSQDDLNSALEAIKGGMAVQKAATEFGIPSGTLYGRCKKVGIELSKNTAVHWSEEDMTSALDSVRTGGMSINQAAIHHHLPYSSLYGRINRLKREQAAEWAAFNTEFQEGDEEGSNGLDFSHILSTSHDYEDSGEGPSGGPLMLNDGQGPNGGSLMSQGPNGGSLMMNESPAASLLQSLTGQSQH